MSPRPDVSAERKGQIYRAALACFERSGFHLTTMDDIAAESGLSKGSLYWYFEGKKELFLALFKETMLGFDRAWGAILAGGETSARAKLRASIDFFRTELEEMVPFFGIMMEAWALTRHDEQVAQAIRELYQPFLDSIIQIIEQGNRNGEFQVHSPEATAMVVLTLFDGIMLALGTGLATQEWDGLMRAAENLVLKGLGVES